MEVGVWVAALLVAESVTRLVCSLTSLPEAEASSSGLPGQLVDHGWWLGGWWLGH